MKKKLKILVPTLILFGSPWMHWIIYHNLLLAWPEIDHSAAHFVGISAGVVCALITFYMIVDE